MDFQWLDSKNTTTNKTYYLLSISKHNFKLEHVIHYLIDNKLDLSVFHPKFKNDDTGRPAYDPAILLKIVLFAYSKGITSSREIEWCCQNNIIFKALSCDTVPYFITIADFVSSRSEEIEIIFEQVLLVCHEQGLLVSSHSNKVG